MGLDVGEYHDWPEMGQSLLIDSCLILAIRGAKWKPSFNPTRLPEMNDDI